LRVMHWVPPRRFFLVIHGGGANGLTEEGQERSSPWAIVRSSHASAMMSASSSVRLPSLALPAPADTPTGLPRRPKSPISCPAPFAKIFPFAAGPNQMHVHRCLVPIRGAIARRHERGAGCGGRESVRRCQGMAGRVDKARELTNGTRTNGALADGEAVWFWHPLLVLNSRRLVGPTGP
jgi:hypothetical protein